MAFHVQVSWAAQGRAMAFNWPEDQVRSRIVEPYESACPIVIDGQQFDPRLSRVTIRRTDQNFSAPGRTLDAWRQLEKISSIVTDDFLVRAPGDKAGIPAADPEPAGGVDPRSVMVIHGRDEARRVAMFEFLRALDLKPLEWGQLVSLTGEGSPYIGDVLTRAFAIAQAAVVVFTPDEDSRLAERLWGDETSEEEKRLAPQARPNVFFEAGMAFGRFPARTVMVEIGSQRQASDLAGRHAVRLDDSAGSRNALAERLAQAGCPVDRTGEAWLTAGAFS